MMNPQISPLLVSCIGKLLTAGWGVYRVEHVTESKELAVEPYGAADKEHLAIWRYSASKLRPVYEFKITGTCGQVVFYGLWPVAIEANGSALLSFDKVTSLSPDLGPHAPGR